MDIIKLIVVAMLLMLAAHHVFFGRHMLSRGVAKGVVMRAYFIPGALMYPALALVTWFDVPPVVWSFVVAGWVVGFAWSHQWWKKARADAAEFNTTQQNG